MRTKKQGKTKKGADLPDIHTITLPEGGHRGVEYGLRVYITNTYDGDVYIDEDSSVFKYRDMLLSLARYLFGLREWSTMEKWQQSALMMFARKSLGINSFTLMKAMEGEGCNSLRCPEHLSRTNPGCTR